NAELSALREQVAQDQIALTDLTNQLEQEKEKAAHAAALEAQIARQQTRLTESKTRLAVARKQAASAKRLRKSGRKNRALLADLKKQIRLAKQQIKASQKHAQKQETVIVDLTTRLYRIKQEEAEQLERVNGIGPRYAARLRTGGITTLNALANANVAQLQEIIQPRRWQKPAFPSWIKQAERLSRKEKSKRK
ncbi:MAG: helix-hairpin-helix domain-containing protein, partial [Anaerolineales bacterium]|nr:helix-hairpin-helix domain-containing protein [Anaerolineales bacterium]